MAERLDTIAILSCLGVRPREVFLLHLAQVVLLAIAGSLVGIIFCLSALPVLYSILRTVFKKISASESAKLQQVVDQLARLTEGSGD